MRGRQSLEKIHVFKSLRAEHKKNLLYILHIHKKGIYITVNSN